MRRYCLLLAAIGPLACGPGAPPAPAPALAPEAPPAVAPAEPAAAEPGVLLPWPRLDTPRQPEREIAWEDAGRHLGEVVAIEARVVSTHDTGRVCFLNFAADWKGKFQAVIFADSYPDYPRPPVELFLDRRVRLIGRVAEYQGHPQIVVDEPWQLEVLPD